LSGEKRRCWRTGLRHAMSDETDWTKFDRARLEDWAAGGMADDRNRGPAKAELLRRDHDYAEEQERSRRKYEDELAQRQMNHAPKLGKEELESGRGAAKAANWAAIAAGLSAIGAIIQAILTARKTIMVIRR